MSDYDSSALSSVASTDLTAPKTTPITAQTKRKRAATTAKSVTIVSKRARQLGSDGIQEQGDSPQIDEATSTRRKSVKLEKRAPEEDSAGRKAKKNETVKTKKRTKQAVVKEEAIEALVQAEEKPGAKVKVKRPRKTKEEKEAEAMPIAARTIGSKVLVGAHVSSAGGVHNAIANSVHIGGNAFALFLKSQRKWENPPLQDDHLTQFLSHCKDHKYDHPTHAIPPIVPHGSYLVNLAHPEPTRATQAYDGFIDDLRRCSKLGIRLYNFHPGSCGASESRSHGIAHLAKQLNKAHKDPSSGNVITLLETMTSSTNIIGATFEDLAETIALVDDKERVGVCLDTCHVFAAGYDLRTPETFKATMDKFEEVVGFKYLRALHVNDSKAPFNSGRDLHANIGTGFLGLRAFHNLVNEPRLWGLPMVLETPIDVKNEQTGKDVPDKSIWATEIKLLESLVGMDVESREFKGMEERLFKRGQAERERIQGQVDRKDEKAKEKQKKEKAKAAKQKAKTPAKSTAKKSKKAAEESEQSSEEESASE